MLPKNKEDNQLRIFQSRLDQMIDMDHPMVRLSERINGLSLEKKLGEVYIPDKGRPHYLRA